MKFVKSILMLPLFLMTNLLLNGQTVSNLNVNPKGNTIELSYDLEGDGSYEVKLFFSDDSGRTWKGPLKLVAGEVGLSQKKGIGKKIIWDAAAEQNEFEGLLQFKIMADPMISASPLKLNNPLAIKLKKYQQHKTLWAASTIITAGIGAYSLMQTGKLYEDYKVATNSAADIRSKINGYNLLGPIAFGLAGFSAVEFIIQSGKYKKNKKLIVSPLYVPKGAALSLALNF